MGMEQLYASFLLDRSQGLEIAIDALNVIEATQVRPIQPMPDGTACLEGVMRLRSDVLPVINMKKRFGLAKTCYAKDAKVAVVALSEVRFGLLFDDIKDVLRVAADTIIPVPTAMLSGERLVAGLIKQDGRILELMDLNRLFAGESLFSGTGSARTGERQKDVHREYRRFVVFKAGGQAYGVPVDYARELTYFTEVDTRFRSGCIDGAFQLRGRTIPVIDARILLNREDFQEPRGDDSRILVLAAGPVRFGMIMDTVREILTVDTLDILSMPLLEQQSVTGLYQAGPEEDIMLLDIDHLIRDHADALESMGNLNAGTEEKAVTTTSQHHLITENGYLVFTIGQYFAIEIKDVQEILERRTVMTIPAAEGYSTSVINLRGQVVPVVRLRAFFGYEDPGEPGERLIICRSGTTIVALEVDTIITIYKQERSFDTPSLNAQLRPKADTLDRLLEYSAVGGGKQHILVINVRNLIRNHVYCGRPPASEGKENAPATKQETSNA